jgi:glycosyltransferase involved in cell wall biosynthesis
VVSWQLGWGQQPALARDAYAAELAVADEHDRAGDYTEAASSFEEAMRTAFHRALHFDGLRSPLAEDPVGFTVPLHESRVGRRLAAGSGGGLGRAEKGREGVNSPGERPGSESEHPGVTRLTIMTRKNDDFLHEIREHFQGHPRFDTQFVDLVNTPSLERLARNPAALVEQLLEGASELPAADEAFRPYLERADVVLVEWCTAIAAMISRVDTTGTRVVVRMHSYEAFTQWPQLTDFSRIDDMVFVSDHLRDLAVAATPGLRGQDAPRLHVIANAMDLRRFVRPKLPEARFTLGVVGASKLVKDPRWAIEVVRHLRKYDERYRLVLIRGKFQDAGPGTNEYAEALQRDLDELEPTGAVRRLAHTDDVPGALEGVGVVISSSVRESFHMGLVEGAASGAVPVVRDWPFFPDSARKLFPADWVVGSPEEAAQRVLALTADPTTWQVAGEAASEHVLSRWDWSVVSREFERLLAAER